VSMPRGPKRANVSRRPVPLAIRLTAEEMAAHDAFVAELKNPLWRS